MAEKTVGLIGIGLLGTALAERLMQADYSVLGFDNSAKATNRFADLGGRPVARLVDVPIAASTIILCLPDSKVVEEVLVKIIPRLKGGMTLIDTTTGEPARTREFAVRLAKADINFVDASVLGSSDMARRGEASLLVGGSELAFNAAQPVLECIATDIHHVGEVGAGQEMKLVANLVLGLNRAALAEGLHFAKTFGLDLNNVLRVLQCGAAYSRIMDSKGPKMIENDFAPQARLSQHLKDVNLILDQAEKCDTQLPLSETHRMLLKKVVDAGDGDLDNSAVFKAWSSAE